MEKTMSVEDKIRRAEEIYYRRKNQSIPTRESIIKETLKNKKNIKLFKKLIKQIIICLLIYSIFYAIINNNYIFSEDFTQKAREILSRDINFSQIYSVFSNALNQQEHNIEKKDKTEKSKEEIQNNEENIGGADALPSIEETSQNEETPALSQMEQDANYIKSTINFMKPLEGTISSMFGLRNPTTATVPKNHTGTDIAAVKGTKIVSATDGTVIYAGNKGDFGKHIKIQVYDVVVLYAHCN